MPNAAMAAPSSPTTPAARPHDDDRSVALDAGRVHGCRRLVDFGLPGAPVVPVVPPAEG